MSMFETQVEYRKEKPRLSFIQDIIVERGVLADWRVLEGLHYKGAGTITPGSHYFKMTLKGEMVGVLMMASPRLLLKERHIVFPKLRPARDSRLTNTARMKWINANLGVVSRVVIDPLFRGAGLAYRFVNLAARIDGKRFIEIQSSMSKYNLFAQKAGFRFVPPTSSNKYDTGMKFLRANFDANPADTEGIVNEIEGLPAAAKAATIENCRHWYARHSMLENTGKSLIRNKDGDMFKDTRILGLSIRALVHQIQQLILACPLYGIYQNPDVGRHISLPISLLAFDKQALDEPLNTP
jgi:hypothetical protein